jgi:hypothetical protein
MRISVWIMRQNVLVFSLLVPLRQPPRRKDLTVSWTKQHLIVAAALVAVMSVPALADAQRRGGGGGRSPRVVVAAPYYYNGSFRADSSARIQVTPRHAEVYVDGYRAGIVDDFDGFAQRLHVPPGEHVIELYLEGHKTISQAILFAPGESYKIRHTMEPLAPGDVEPTRPTPKPGANTTTARTNYDAFGQPMSNGLWKGNSSRSAGARRRIVVDQGAAW